MRGAWRVLCFLCLLSCKTGKQMQRHSQMDSLMVNHHAMQATEWNLDSLVSAMQVTFDSLEIVCLPDTALVPAVMKHGIVLKAKRSEVKRSQAWMKEGKVSETVTDSALAATQRTEKVRIVQQPGGTCNRGKWRTVLAVIVLAVLVWYKIKGCSKNYVALIFVLFSCVLL